MPTHSFKRTCAERHPQADSGLRVICESVCVRVCESSEVHHYPSIKRTGQQNDTANCTAVVGQ